MIEFEHVNKTYDKATDRETKAVRDISLKIDRGEFVFIVGNSGSGKTTLIRLLLKEIEASSGSIRVGDTELTSMKRKMIPRYRRRLGVVFQDFRLLKDRNVYENVAFAQRVVVTPTREIKKRVPEVLSMVGLSSKYKSAAQPAFRRRTAAGGDCPCPGEPAGDPSGRRANRKYGSGERLADHEALRRDQ